MTLCPTKAPFGLAFWTGPMSFKRLSVNMILIITSSLSECLHHCRHFSPVSVMFDYCHALPEGTANVHTVLFMSV